ncbi:hypothetical protein Manayef4_17490 [Frankia sp. CgMI4]|uniref:YbaB/EbfC family nucleoid-associated protein n=1 Tax=Frankia sp. CgMI4 TaxID=1742262 RepID=UPI0008726CCC|nr:YbaB/EbfC family nucleoid-associated protein [Frankia sp. CgIM4]OFB41234.1 hypothetical protein Manayef4_17490 [Frankia sp. CgIM4]
MSNPQNRAGSGASAGGGALGQLFEQAQKMQAAILATQEDLATARVDGTAGGGLVRATVNGGGELVDLTISPEAVDPEDTETLADLILAAVRDATTNAHKLAADRMDAITGGLGAGGPAGPGGADGLGGLGGLGGLLSGGGLGGPPPGGPGLPGLG